MGNDLSADLAASLTDLQQPGHPDAPQVAQSLSQGAIGIALLHVERARAGSADWDTARHWLEAALRGGVSADPGTHLFGGIPAVAFVLASTEPHCQAAFKRAHELVGTVARARLADAHERIDRARLPEFTEYDLLYGLTGLGAYLLRTDPGSTELTGILEYLVRLTEPIKSQSAELPGWWVSHDPDLKPSPGHANFGLAHGVAGPLALLSLAHRRGIHVPGQLDTVRRIVEWFDQWRHDTDTGSWWPQWIGLDEFTSGHSKQTHPKRPSWCYGTPGIVRAQQLAAIALGDTDRQDAAEAALVACLSNPDQLATITDPGLCHGQAGLLQTIRRTAADARHPSIARFGDEALERLVNDHDVGAAPGFLIGDAGVALALHSASTDTPHDWDACLLLT